MQQLPFCYVSIPFGTKPIQDTDQQIDFERVYFEMIRPAVDRTGLTCLRGDELPPSSIVQAEILRAVVNSTLMIADLTTLNPNVLYELGIRHALSLTRTILLTQHPSTLPFNLSMIHVATYSYPPSEGDVERLAQAVQHGLIEQSSSSPLYGLVPDLLEEVPGVLRRAERIGTAWTAEKRGPTGTQEVVSARLLLNQIRNVSSAAELSARLEQTGPRLWELTTEAPEIVGEVIRGYRKTSDWNGLIAFTERLDPEVRGSKEVVQEVALALLRRRELGDVDLALEMATGLCDRHNDDPDVLGLLGRLLTERYRISGNESDLDDAIDAYHLAFDIDTREPYAGLQALELLMFKGDLAAANRLLPRVREALSAKNESYPVGAWPFWDVAAQLELSIIAKDWDEGMSLASILTQRKEATWQLDALALRLDGWNATMADDESRAQLALVRAELGGGDDV